MSGLSDCRILHARVLHHLKQIFFHEKIVLVCVILEEKIHEVTQLDILRDELISAPAVEFLHVVKLVDKLIVLNDLIQSCSVSFFVVGKAHTLRLERLTSVVNF